MPTLVKVKTSLGRCAHWKAEGHRTALCGGPGPFVAGGEGLPMCLSCQRREDKARAGIGTQGEKNFDAVVRPQPPSRSAIGEDYRLAAQPKVSIGPGGCRTWRLTGEVWTRFQAALASGDKQAQRAILAGVVEDTGG